jgi:polar amino acid transport system substrate-binding protein
MLFPFRSYKNRQRFSLSSLAFAGIVISLLLLSACGGSSAGSAPSTSGKATVKAPNDLIKPGALIVGSDTTYAPQEFIDTATGDPAGFDIDLIKAMAQKMGLTASVQTAKFDSIIDSLDAKRFDVVISAITITADREKKADFVPYFYAGESLLVQKGNPKHITSVSDLCGLNVGVQNGTVEQTDLQTASQACQKAGKSPITVQVLQDQTAVIQLLATGRVVATYQDSPVTDYYLKLYPGRFSIGGSVVNAAQEGIAVRKGDTSMLNAMQAAFNAVRSDGTYHSLILKWGLSNEELK